jgi:methyl-accepting chemotaxis protein
LIWVKHQGFPWVIGRRMRVRRCRRPPGCAESRVKALNPERIDDRSDFAMFWRSHEPVVAQEIGPASRGGATAATNAAIAAAARDAEALRALGTEALLTSEELASASESASMVVMNVRMVTGMMGEVARSLHEVDGRVVDSQTRAAAAAADAARAKEQIDRLQETLKEIANVARLIKDIARHTNLLSLNAAIEAARAGSAGAGFAVVANEVKSLADQTSNATEEIDRRLATIRQATHEVVKSVGGVSDSFESICELVQGISVAVRDSAGAYETIQASTDEACTSVEDIAGTLDRIAERSRETAARAGESAQLSS